jgi:hypothetical protein
MIQAIKHFNITIQLLSKAVWNSSESYQTFSDIKEHHISTAIMIRERKRKNVI